MARKNSFVIRDPYILVNGVNLSAWVREVEVAASQADVDNTTAGADGTERLAGLRDDSFTITFASSFAASEVMATLWQIFDDGDEFTVKVAPRGSVVSTTNPAYTGTCIATELPVISGAIGALATQQVKFPVIGKIDPVYT